MENSLLAYLFLLLLLGSVAAGVPERALAQEPPKKVPVTVTADKLDYDRASDVYIAVGHVKVEQGDIRIDAEKVVLNNKTGVAEAEGNIFLQDKDDLIQAQKVKMNLDTREGVITNGSLFMKKDNYHLKAEVIDRRSETEYHVEHGEFTSCDEDQWYLKADEMNIDMAKYATGRNVSFNIQGVPVLYTPYFLFPVRRQSGFLIPVAGYSSSEGAFADNALFWAISDYQDMTFYSDYRAKIGHGTGLEYRYMNSRESSGQTYAKVWDMYHSGQTRWEFRVQHQEEFAEDLSARADINLVSDDRYYYELDKRIEMRSLPYVDSNAFYVERWNTASLYLLGQYATDLTRTNEKTVQKLPELRYTIFEETIGGPVHLNFEGAATNFVLQSQNGVRRIDFNPQLTAAFGNSGLSLTPRAGARATFYDQGAATAQAAERKYVYAGADLNSRISRVYGADGEAGIGRIRHSIEPTVSYSYIPRVDQTDIPQLDSLDVVTSQNLATIALVNRLTANYRESKSSAFTTYDMMVFKLSQSYDLSIERDPNNPAHARSDLLGELYVRTPKFFTVTANASYNTYDHVVSSHTFGAGLTAAVVSLNLAESYSRGVTPIQYIIGGMGLNLGKWNLTGQGARDIENRKTTQENYSLHYSGQCWGFTVNYTAMPGEYRYTAMVDLKGIGNRGYDKK